MFSCLVTVRPLILRQNEVCSLLVMHSTASSMSSYVFIGRSVLTSASCVLDSSQLGACCAVLLAAPFLLYVYEAVIMRGLWSADDLTLPRF